MKNFILRHNGLEGQNKKVQKFLFKPLPTLFQISIPHYDLTKYCTIEKEGKVDYIIVRTVAQGILTDVTEYEGKFEFLSSLRALAKELHTHSGKSYVSVLHCLPNKGLKKSITALSAQG